MLRWLKAQVEAKLGSGVDNKELFTAMGMAKDDVVSNCLAIGHDVTSKHFVEVTANCINIIRNGTNKPVGISQPSQICPDCKSRLVPDSGCSFCPNCGWSQCK